MSQQRAKTNTPHDIINMDILNKIKRLYNNTLSTKYSDNLTLNDEDIVWGLDVLKQLPTVDITTENIQVGSNGANKDGTIRILELRFQDQATYDVVKNVGFPLRNGSRAQLFPKFVPERYQRREYTIRLSGVPLGASKDEVLRLVEKQFEGQKFEISNIENIPLQWGTATVPTNRWAAHVRMFKPGAPLHFDIQNMRFNRTYFPERMVHFAVRALQKRVSPRGAEPQKAQTEDATTSHPNPGQMSQGAGKEATPEPEDEEEDVFFDPPEKAEDQSGSGHSNDDSPQSPDPENGGHLVPAILVTAVQDDPPNNTTTRDGALQTDILTSPVSVPVPPPTTTPSYAGAVKSVSKKVEDGPPVVKPKPNLTPLTRQKRSKPQHSDDERTRKTPKSTILTPLCEEALSDYLKERPPTFKIGKIPFQKQDIIHHVERMESCDEVDIKEGDDWLQKMVIHLLATKGKGRQRQMLEPDSVKKYNLMAAATLRAVCGGRKEVHNSAVPYYEDLDPEIRHLWLGELSEERTENPRITQLVNNYMDEYNRFTLLIRGEEDAGGLLNYKFRGSQQHT